MAVAVFLVLLSSMAYTQSGSMKGLVRDSINKINLANSSVVLLRKADSVLYAFTRTDNGHFEFKQVKEGNYILVVTHPLFADYVDNITVTPNVSTDAGTVKMLLKAKLLEDVVVRQTIAAIKMKGDTLEYTADSFKLRQGASVEELLKKLPGIQVDKDGKITAQGEKVEKVLVDGEEFFGDDPTIATKGLAADALEKVQVFDKKSDQATFTGIDDGQRTKTLNLKLKEDKKKGYFGKVDVGGGKDDRWNNTAMVNAFKGKRKLSAYGIMSSTGKTGLSWNERDNYGEGMNMEMMDDGIYFFGGGDDFGSESYYGQGLPKSWSGAVHYSNKFNDDKQHINGSYRFNKLNAEGVSNTFTQSLIPGDLFYSRYGVNSFSTKFQHAMNGLYDIQLDSSSSIKFTVKSAVGQNRGFQSSFSESFDSNGNLYNRSNSTTPVNGDNRSLNSTLLLRKRFKKPGRTISLNLDQQYQANDSKSFLNSLNEFFKNNAVDSVSRIDQQKNNNTKSFGLTSRLVYTEPLSKKIFAEVSYGLRVSNIESERLSYNADNNGKYVDLDLVYSNKYQYNFLINSGGLNFKYNGKKITANAGSDLAYADFIQKDFLRLEEVKRSYTNLFPKANITYKFNTNSRFSINYNGNTKQPSITQIQPVKDNSNPLNIAEGNPDLQQEFRHQFRIGFNSYKVLNQRGFNINANLNRVDNAITLSETIDKNRARTYKYINANGVYSYGTWVNYGLKLKKLDAYINFGLNINGSRNISYINGEKNVTNNFRPGLNFSFNKGVDKKYSFNLWSNASFNSATSTVNKNVETQFWTYQIEPNLNITLPYKFEINIESEIYIRQKTSVFDENNNVYLLNGYLGRKILKNDKGMIKITGYDILDQNKGFSRNIDNIRVTENTYQVLRQYFTLSFVWNFSKTPAGMGPSED